MIVSCLYGPGWVVIKSVSEVYNIYTKIPHWISNF